ncbi:hypothetical protein HOE04_01550 [archaeon]|jgi:hypothetical protein|nr:hypothetical protein [archaeon]
MTDYDCCYIEPVLRRLRAGEEVRLAVPIYNSRTQEWIHDLNFFAVRAEKRFDEAMKSLEDLG